MEPTEPDLNEMRVGPAERPDDPLATARRNVTRSPLVPPPPPPKGARQHAPPTPDQEGCYFLG